MHEYEKLGAFYLGREFDLAQRRRLDPLVLYDSKDLVTHAVCVGMTGSGKTGLCIGLLEEAAIDGIPAIVIDPKGDLPNLLLNFPGLSADEFAPWVNADDARKAGLGVPEFAQREADRWRAGLAEWGQDAARVERLRAAAEFAVYTPGSSAGLPISLLRSFDAPPAALREESDLYRERLTTTATSLLGLLGVDADPLRSREHILISTLLDHAWRADRNVDLAALVQLVQTPPFTRVGVMDLEAFYPAAERFPLAMALNNLIASPTFESWTAGPPLDVQSLLYTQQGRPRVAIFSIAHLGDAERMFFVSTLLNHVLGWVRRQSGTTSLRAILYMDEIAGYCPPVASVPSKAPLLLLMKQARAFGLGVVLATQNPVDLDYKGLANAGTWFIGRMQTERDKERVLDGLAGAAAASAARFDREGMSQALSQLSGRKFVLSNVHDDAPCIFETRWTLSYLRGPLTREQIRQLPQPRAAEVTNTPRVSAAVHAAPASSTAATAVRPIGPPPVLPTGVAQFFAPLRLAQPADAVLQYEPMLLGSASVFFSDAKLDVECERLVTRVTQIVDGPIPVDWQNASESALRETELEPKPAADARFVTLPPEAGKARSYDAWRREFVEALFRGLRLELLHSPALKLTARDAEAERDFRARLALAAHEQRDARVEKLRAKYAPKLAALEQRLARAEQTVETQRAQARESQVSSAVSIGSTLLSVFLGRKKTSVANVSRAGTAIRGVGRARREAGDVERAQDAAELAQQKLAELEAEFQAEVEALSAQNTAASTDLETVVLKPRKTNIRVRLVTLVWLPTWLGPRGHATPAWEPEA